LITVQQRLGNAGMSNDLMTQMASNALSAAAPENDPFLKIQHAKPGGKVFQDAPADFKIVNYAHTWAKIRYMRLSTESGVNFKLAGLPSARSMETLALPATYVVRSRSRGSIRPGAILGKGGPGASRSSAFAGSLCLLDRCELIRKP
jgi:hypothetical protein